MVLYGIYTKELGVYMAILIGSKDKSAGVFPKNTNTLLINFESKANKEKQHSCAEA